MILTDFFSGAQLKNNKTQKTVPKTALSVLSGKTAESGEAAKALQSLKPGQTLQGEVIAKNGNQIQIKLEDDSVMEARVERDVNLQPGKAMTFEVRGNGQNLTLSPLFSNTATQENALKALEMASLPANQTTVSMTGLMMEAGLSVDRNALQQMFREVNSFPRANVSDVVDLHKLGLEVNEGNLAQVNSYKNLTHQLVDGIHDVLSSLPQSMESMAAEGHAEGAARMFQDILDMLGEESGTAWRGADAAAVLEDNRTLAAQTMEAQIPHTDGSGQSGKVIISDIPEQAMGTGESMQTQPDNSLQGTAGELLKLAQSTGGDNETYAALIRQFSDALQNGTVAEQARTLQQIFRQGMLDKNNILLQGLVANKGLQKFLTDGFTKLWTISPEEVADKGKVEELYSRLNRQLNHLSNALEENAQQHTAAYKAVSNMTQNIDFLQQLNEAYTYVQLPLRLQQGEARGELYVYTNKRNLAARDGQISALLHLDMEHLGPVDVYVALQSERVSTRFWVQDDEMLDFLEAHMELLTKRLQKRGYDCSFSMQTKGQNAQIESGLNGLLEKQPTQHVKPIAQYAFDVRA